MGTQLTKKRLLAMRAGVIGALTGAAYHYSVMSDGDYCGIHVNDTKAALAWIDEQIDKIDARKKKVAERKTKSARNHTEA